MYHQGHLLLTVHSEYSRGLFNLACFAIGNTWLTFFAMDSALLGQQNDLLYPAFSSQFVLINLTSIHSPHTTGKIYIFISCNKLDFKDRIYVVGPARNMGLPLSS